MQVGWNVVLSKIATSGAPKPQKQKAVNEQQAFIQAHMEEGHGRAQELSRRR